MKYGKPALTFEQQADQLLNRGMTGDRSLIVERLGQVSYYRLSGYWHPFRSPNPSGGGVLLDGFRPGTSFDEVWTRYVFDRRLRLLVLDAIERIEIKVRSLLAYHHSHEFGLFDYAGNSSSLPGCSGKERAQFLQGIQTEVNRSKDAFVKALRFKVWLRPQSFARLDGG